jgi:hypothetical protein
MAGGFYQNSKMNRRLQRRGVACHLLVWLHVFTSCPQLFLEAVRLNAYEHVLRETLLCLLREKSLAVTVILFRDD